MKGIWCFILVIVIVSCKKEKEYTVEDIQIINGYWQISDVLYPDGSEKKYSLSGTIDYIKLDSLKGYRKKMYPQLDGTYLTSDDAQNFYIVKKASKGFFINYHNELTSWQESIIYLEPNKFYLESAEGIVYRYKRFEPINIYEDGKTSE
ncbi:hypothetical protein [Croceivirga thetidis]|uniref:Lipocalin-like domain-containing protein n=1 Tax=Croceivirga thetidis TaxID=2721623 RepID=A0ABX1GSA8_9FLAO|nr:hypothetical protein [Croceivirga thetidis]NKI32828.1 hypothetical protein [Croceivirga thetidis]